MDFNLTDLQLSSQTKAHDLGKSLGTEASADDVIRTAATAGLLDPRADLLSAAVAVEALAYESSSAGVSLALHTGVTAGLDGDSRFSALARGETVGAIALSSDDVPVEQGGRLSGRAAWVTP